MSLTIVVLLLAVAFTLILVEIFLIPGIGIPGLVGAALLLTALVLAYTLPYPTGHWVLGATALVSAALVVVALRSKTWDKMTQKVEITGRAGAEHSELRIGDHGLCVGRLSPSGKARFSEKEYEVSSTGPLIEAGTAIEIVTIEPHKITVIPLTT